jgi:hypothetical protein
MYRAPCRISRRLVAASPAKEQCLSAIAEQRILFRSNLIIILFVVIDGLVWPKIQIDLDFTAPHFRQDDLKYNDTHTISNLTPNQTQQS